MALMQTDSLNHLISIITLMIIIESGFALMQNNWISVVTLQEKFKSTFAISMGYHWALELEN